MDIARITPWHNYEDTGLILVELEDGTETVIRDDGSFDGHPAWTASA